MTPAIEGRAMSDDKAAGLQTDTRPVQAARVADYLAQHPPSTQKEIDAACDTGCISKVLSVMSSLGYGIGKGRRNVSCT
jgi:hypothetical protein